MKPTKFIILLWESNKEIVGKIEQELVDKFSITEEIDISTSSVQDFTIIPEDDNLYIGDYTNVECYSSNFYLVEDVKKVSDIAEKIASYYMKPKVTWTDDLTTAKGWLAEIDKRFTIVAVDFESNDLTLPQFNELTMVTIGWSLHKSVVIVFKDYEIRDYVLNWLVTTNLIQVFHNSIFDVRFIHYYTNKLPKQIEDSQLLAAVYKNHVNPIKGKTSLKELAKVLYMDWGSDKSSFDLYDTSLNSTVENLTYVGPSKDISKYNLALIKYCGIDSLSTKFIYDKFSTEKANPSNWIMPTSEPRDNTEQFNQRYYYDFILKPAIPVIVEMLNNGQGIDLSLVSKLEKEVKAYNIEILKKINSYSLVQNFQARVDKVRIDKFIEPILKVFKHPQYVGYKSTVAMRTFVVNYYSKSTYERVTAVDLKTSDEPICKLLLKKQFTHPAVVSAANKFEEEECLRQNTNTNRIDKISNPAEYVKIGFNPYNYQQLTQMWLSFGLESDEKSKTTDEMSFSSKVLERLSKTTIGEVGEIIKLHLEVAQSKNMITQYNPKFHGSSVDGRLYLALKIFGTKTARLSGKAAKMPKLPQKHQTGANGVTMPTGHKVYGKTVKRMFIAPKGKILAYVDYNNLEGHISGILTKDKTKLAILKGEYGDMHSLHACYFFRPQLEKQFNLDLSDITPSIVSELYGTDSFTSWRTRGKSVTFGLELTTTQFVA